MIVYIVRQILEVQRAYEAYVTELEVMKRDIRNLRMAQIARRPPVAIETAVEREVSDALDPEPDRDWETM